MRQAVLDLLLQCVRRLEQEISIRPLYDIACFKIVHDSFVRLLVAAESASYGQDHTRTEICARTLITLADEHINVIDFHLVEHSWLALYADASLLLALNIAVHDEGELCIATAIRQLDLSLIITGATEQDRSTWTQKAITILQSMIPFQDWSGNHMDSSDEFLKLSSKYATQNTPLYAKFAVPVLDMHTTIETYLKNHREHPFILRNYVGSTDSPCPAWPALHRWASHSYLLDVAGPHRHVPVEVGNAYVDDDWGQQILSFEEFLGKAGYRAGMPDGTALYLAQHDLFRQFPRLRDDIVIPDYIWSSPGPTKAAPQYTAPGNEDGVLINVWVGSGNRDIVSPAHTDPYYNCYVQVLGRKRIWLASPDATPYMNAYGGSGKQEGGALRDEYMPNTSSIPILRHDHDLGQYHSKYAEFSQAVAGSSIETVLEAGDMLVMPPGWWHAMRPESEGPNWSVSMWF